MNKFKFFLCIDKEQNWLNDMSKEGYRFISKRFLFYKFEHNEGDMNYQYYVEQIGILRDCSERVDFLLSLHTELVDKQWGFYYFEVEDTDDIELINSDPTARINNYLRCTFRLFLIGMINIMIICNARGPYLFNISIPLVFNAMMLCLVLFTIGKYLRRVLDYYEFK